MSFTVAWLCAADASWLTLRSPLAEAAAFVTSFPLSRPVTAVAAMTRSAGCGGEERVVLLAPGVEEGNQVEDLLAGQLVEQAFGHDRRGRLLAGRDIGDLDLRRGGLGQWILDDLDHRGGLFDDEARDRHARFELEDLRLEFLIDLRRRVEKLLEQIQRLQLGVELREVGAELVAHAIELVTGDAA